ncbi:stage V sporulation protein AD [Blautia sp. MSJ-19]|uniref:stage V sporulation protein AD n=1 Tax=Blautia sp. MSJ-19 TaxID=2841517 RepID=UPI001C0EBFAA|nr:stage V sporulation protein AD [Blautia sp. MSJ-19]MBU5481200.1 stage V sporulation protein AD [Blautia sp. MSJ-19]
MRSGILLGKASIAFSSPVYIQSCASVVGSKEGNGPLKDSFDMICDDPMFGEKTWEAAESTMQKEVATLAIGKAGLTPGDIRFVFAGDLLAQTIASSFGIAEMGIPFFGLYGACSTMGESLSLGAIAVSAGYGQHILCATSSHFATAEKEFRFPLGYGSQRPLSATWTVTGSGACILGAKPPHPRNTVGSSPLCHEEGYAAVTGITTGRVIDFGFRDSLNMGGCMAPAACDTIRQHLQDFDLTADSYDAVITGDLGLVGQRILLDLLKQDQIDLASVHQDCGLLIYDNDSQDTHSGGSGCGCSASVLSALLLPKVASGIWKKILFVPTGAMLSKVSFNEGAPVAGIAHAIVLEHIPKTKEA